MIKRIKTLSSVLLFFIVVSGMSQSYAQELRLSGLTTNAENPAIATTPLGVSYVVWQENINGNWEIVLCRVTDQGTLDTTFGRINISETSGSSILPDISVDEDGNAYIVWQESGVIYFSVVNTDGEKIVDRMIIKSSSCAHPHISTTLDGVSNIVFEQQGGIYYRILFSQIDQQGDILINSKIVTDNILSVERYLSIATNRHRGSWYGVSYIFWRDIDSWYSYGLYLTELNPDGSMGRYNKKKFLNGEYAIYPHTALSTDNAHIYFQNRTSNGYGVFSYNNGSPLRIDQGGGNAQKPSADADGNNTSYICWQDNRNGKWDIYINRLDQVGQFDENELRITDGASDSMEPDLTVVDGHWHLVWQDQKDGVWQIYYHDSVPETVKLLFPLHGYNPYSAPISSTFDHTMTGPYAEDGLVTAYTGEYGSYAAAGGDCKCYSQSNQQPFVITGHYIGTGSCGNGNYLCYDGHPGIDYPVVNNTPVYAACDGIIHHPVSFPGVPNAQYYKTIELDHQNGYKIYYLHLSRQVAKEGESVSQGDLIGYSGDTGSPGAYHLHFEVQKNGIPVDPYGWEGDGQDPYQLDTNRKLWLSQSMNFDILCGFVMDSKSGQPIAEARVTVEGSSTHTDRSGHFSFNNISPGQVTVSVFKSGYYPTSRKITLHEGSSSSLSIPLIQISEGTFPVVVQVEAQYCGPGRNSTFLGGVSLQQTFNAIIDWNGHQPGQVKWITPTGTLEDPCPGSSDSRTFDMGFDFGPNGQLKVIAVSDDNITSPEYHVNFRVVPLPPYAEMWPDVRYFPVFYADTFKYRIQGIDELKIDLATWAPENIDTSFPIFGGKKMKIGVELQKESDTPYGTFSGVIDSHGHADLFSIGWDDKLKATIRKGVWCRKGIKLPYAEMKSKASFDFGFDWSEQYRQWRSTGGMAIGCNVKYSTIQVPFGMIWGIPVYGRAEISLDLDAELMFLDLESYNFDWEGSLDFEPLAKLILGAGLAHAACVEGYGGGGFHGAFDFYPKYDWTEAYALLVCGVQATMGPFSFGPVEWKYTWPQQDRSAKGLNELFRAGRVSLLSRDYLGYYSSKGSVMEPVTKNNNHETPIELSTFPYPVPSLANVDNSSLAVWVADDTQRNLINRTALQYSKYSSGTWTSPLAIADDGTADLNPELVSIPGGGAVLIWQNLNDILDDNDSIETFNSHTDIAAVIYNQDTNNWDIPLNLTSDSILDRSPHVAAASSDDIIAVWITNLSNDLWGSPEKTNTIRWSRFDGTAWQEAANVSSGISTILGSTLAYDGSTATYVYTVDADGDLDTTQDQELWAVTYTSGIWSAPQQLTSDSISDASPRLFQGDDGLLKLVWMKGDQMMIADGLQVPDAAVIMTPGESLQSKDFSLAVGNEGNVAIVWNDTSETYNDLFVSYYTPAGDAWSEPVRLTTDDAAEKFVSCNLETDNSLVCMYAKTQTEYEDRQVDVLGQNVTVEQVPKAGRTDLYGLDYQLGIDLAVGAEDLNIYPISATTGSSANLTAIVKNIGEIYVSEAEVAFYDCDSRDICSPIGSVQTISSLIAGGNGTAVSIPWVIPESNAIHVVKVEVDPYQKLDDRDITNNIASIIALKPDMEIESFEVLNAGENRNLKARLANIGASDAKYVQFSIHRDSTTGEQLYSVMIPEITRGTYKDVTFVWNRPLSLDKSHINTFAVVDEFHSLDESDLSNNIAELKVAPFYYDNDFDHDNDVDGEDLVTFIDSGGIGEREITKMADEFGSMAGFYEK